MTPHPTYRQSSGSDDGIAMVLALLFMLLLSALGSAMLLLSRTETMSSVNYRLMSQARYGAESGVHKAAHFLLNSYASPGPGSGEAVESYDITTTPVRYAGQPVVLSAQPGVAANYSLESVQAAFAAAAQGSLAVDSYTVGYSTTATLLSMRTVTPYGASGQLVVQTWRLTARGVIQGTLGAEVEVSAVIERQIIPTFTYGLFATNDVCGVLDFSGGVRVDSYDSSNITLVSGVPQTDNWGGHVGTNGNLTESGHSIVYGSMSTPRRGIGNCKNGAVNAIDFNGPSQVIGGLVQLPQEVVLIPPDYPYPAPPTNTVTISGSPSCSGIPITSGSCSLVGGQVTLNPLGSPMLLGDLRVNAGKTLVLQAGTYHLNSIKLNGNANLIIGSGPVILSIAGENQGTPVDLEGGAVINPSFLPANFRILYSGAGEMKLTGGASLSASIYAPLADAKLAGGANYYGGVVAKNVTMSGGVQFHYDRRLDQFFTVGPQMMSVFTWKEY